jgi:hypothetical protein
MRAEANKPATATSPRPSSIRPLSRHTQVKNRSDRSSMVSVLSEPPSRSGSSCRPPVKLPRHSAGCPAQKILPVRAGAGGKGTSSDPVSARRAGHPALG